MSRQNSTISSKQLHKTKERKKQSDKLSMVLTRGTRVEVRYDEEGFGGAWFDATILKPQSSSKPKSKAKVIFSTLLASDGVHPLCEEVCVGNIRPFPPNDENVRSFEVGEVVDAYYSDAWWKAVVVSVKEVTEEKKYRVLFENSEEMEFYASQLRAHFDWIDNKWVTPPKQIDEKVVKIFSESKLVPHLQFVEGKWVRRRSQDSSLTSSCQGQSDGLVHNKERKANVAAQLGISNVLNNSSEKPWNYFDILNSKFKGSKRRACRSKAGSCCLSKKFRGEKYATESHEKSEPSVESMCPVNSGSHEEEATVEADMMNSVDGEENTAEYMAIGSLENSCGSMIHDQPLNSCLEGEMGNGKGETDNGKGALEEMFTLQFSADIAAGVNVVDVGVDDQWQLLCLQEETSVPLVATLCVETIVTDDPATECVLKSCAASNTDKKSQLCSEGGETNSKLMSAETSTSLSGIDFPTNKPDTVGTPEGPDKVGMTIDHTVESHVASAVHPPKFSCLEGHMPRDSQNQFDDQRNGGTITGTESPVTNVEVNNALDENEVMPFVKNSPLWKTVESFEIFKLLPQKPHFRPLMDSREVFREGFAIGYMATFSDVAEKICKLQVSDSENKFKSFLETLLVLELHGFRVEPLVDRVNMLLSMKGKLRKIQDQAQEVDTQLAYRIREHDRLNDSILAMDKLLSELKKEWGLHVLLEKNRSRDITNLQRYGSSINESISAVNRNFESLRASSW